MNFMSMERGYGVAMRHVLIYGVAILGVLLVISLVKLYRVRRRMRGLVSNSLQRSSVLFSLIYISLALRTMRCLVTFLSQ
jgi:hypothetical protein